MWRIQNDPQAIARIVQKVNNYRRKTYENRSRENRTKEKPGNKRNQLGIFPFFERTALGYYSVACCYCGLAGTRKQMFQVEEGFECLRCRNDMPETSLPEPFIATHSYPLNFLSMISPVASNHVGEE